MNCGKCHNLIDIDNFDSPYVIRTCSNCGRDIKLREAGENGHGIKIEKGDRFIFPKNFIKIAANPLKSTGTLSTGGLEWFAKLIFVEDLPQQAESILEIIKSNDTFGTNFLHKSELLQVIDWENPEDIKQIYNILSKNQSTSDWWVYLFVVFNEFVEDGIKENDAKKAAWAMACAERCRSMFVFKENFEEVVRMGQSAKRIVNVLRIWETNKSNTNEEYWQQLFIQNPYVLSQVFSVPVIFIKDKAYLGGMNVDRQDAKFVDYLYTSETSNDAILVEVKTPETRLLGPKYRKGVNRPSNDLTGSVVQVLDYRKELSKNVDQLTHGTSHKIDIFSPRCMVILGNAEKELDTEKKRKSFELFRANLKDVEIVTYDELFKKAETLATLFNLIKKST